MTNSKSRNAPLSKTVRLICATCKPLNDTDFPLLFTIYVNDMCNVSKLLKFILFADDTNIFHSHSKLPDLVSELNTELDKMYKWFCVNKLSLNIAKTNYILFGRYTHQQHIAIIINNVTI